MDELKIHDVCMTIHNKENAGDPEGDIIYKDLILKGNKDVINISMSKVLIFSISAFNPDDAIRRVRKIAEDLKVYNPISSDIKLKCQPS